MNSELSDAYYGVYCSSREILKNNQRHLFCNMLDLLTNTCKTTGISCKKISNDDSVQFWILRILPLLFDEDVSIQSSAVSALEQGLVNLDINSIHTSMHWPEIKSKIISSYAVRINKLRDDKNDNWHKVWCLLITILDTDILKGASTINTFLAIVELGFRSPDNKIRAEAFLCWRRLIKTFSDYNELSSPKRLKLICIPLKSSQSKSSEAAEVKLRVWWYLFSCLGQQLESVFECTVEPFLSFCLGNPGRSTTSAIHQYPSLRNLAITCIASLFATENNISIQRLFNENNLEPIPQPSPLLSKFVIKKHWQPIASTILEAVRQINFSNDVSDCSLQLLHLLIRFTTVISIRNCETSFFAYNCTELKKMLPDHTRPVLSWFNTFATEGPIIYTTFEDLKSYTSALAAVMELFCAARLVIPPSIFERCITHAFKFPDNDCIGSVLIQILDVVISASDDIDFETFQTKLLVWRHVSNNILLCLKENSFDYRDNRDISTILNQWTIWPLKTCMSFAGHQSLENFDNSFATVWGKLLNARQNCAGRNHLLSATNLNLLELLTSRKEDASFPGLFDFYVSACLKYGIQQNSTTTKELFNLFNAVASAPLQGKSLELCLSTFKNMLNEFSNADITSVFDSIKNLISKVGRPSTNEGIDTTFYEDWKREILDRIRTHPNKAFLTEIKDILLRNDVFVIIPSVWSLNPEKLTDRQKERYAEKHDIPALYNDMSQSQDALIKPWTPKKVVIAKEQHAEIVLKKTDANNASQSEAADTCAHENVCEEESSVENLKNDESPSKKAPRSLPEPKGYSLRRLKNSSISDERFADVNDNDVSQRTRRSSLKIKPVEVMSKTEVSTNSSTDKSNKPTESPTLRKTSLTEDQSKEVKTYSEQQPSQSVIEITGNIETVLKSLGENETHSSRKVITENNTDNQPHSIASLQTCRDNVLQKETSPKKANQIKFTPLQSPPDRKLINNTSSPTLRPKPSTHLTGRGAQLINMIRNKKPEPTPYYISTSLNKSNQQQSSKDDKFCENHITDLTENNPVEVTLTPVQAKDLLIFSKRLPPPTASPSASILKRKFRRDSIDDLATDSPAFKRKRVSFHDPPVSVTKEYIRDIEDNKSKLKRCLLPEKNTIVAEIKHALKRKSKLESIVEIEKYNFDRCKNDNDYDSTLKWNDSQNTSLEPNTSLREPNTNIAETLDYESALKIVVQNCSIETVLEQFFSSENLQLQRSASFLTKFLSNQMTKNTKITKDVLEILSENHSKAFLDHAIQENLSSVVCDRLNLNSVIDFVCAKSKINSACRSSLLAQVPEILQNSRINSERINFIKNLIHDSMLSDDSILDLIALLLKCRRMLEDSKPEDSVSVSAVDSSSNL